MNPAITKSLAVLGIFAAAAAQASDRVRYDVEVYNEANIRLMTLWEKKGPVDASGNSSYVAEKGMLDSATYSFCSCKIQGLMDKNDDSYGTVVKDLKCRHVDAIPGDWYDASGDLLFMGDNLIMSVSENDKGVTERYTDVSIILSGPGYVLTREWGKDKKVYLSLENFNKAGKRTVLVHEYATDFEPQDYYSTLVAERNFSPSVLNLR